VDSGAGEAVPDGDPANDCDIMLPAGRWVLPDDWPALAGPRWWEFRPRWDIMDNPYDLIWGDTELGPYNNWSPVTWAPPYPAPLLVAAAPVIGPYDPLDTYTPPVTAPLTRKTIVPNGELDWWDCPMPPAKIVFEVLNPLLPHYDYAFDETLLGLEHHGAGFFKQVDKGDVYYLGISPYDDPFGWSHVYTNPYYETELPAHDCIPAFVNNGGYDWDSWERTLYGPYPFWEIFNQPPGDTFAIEQRPTKVEVYSDNHGEAMVYLNGDWNLNLTRWTEFGGMNPPAGEPVAVSDVIAVADYPYLRKHVPMVSNVVTKTWIWGKEILGMDLPNATVTPDNRMVFQVGALDDTLWSMEKMVFVWVCDRDGIPAVGERIDWTILGDRAKIQSNMTQYPASTVPNVVDPITGDTPAHLWVGIENGFLVGTGGVAFDDQHGTSYTRMPTWQELILFNKIWPGRTWHHAVAAIVLSSSYMEEINLWAEFYEREGILERHIMLDWNFTDDWDDPIVPGDANTDGGVDMADVTMVERMIMGMDGNQINADANWDQNVDMVDVTKIEMMILGF
jgi:hypothetical protein